MIEMELCGPPVTEADIARVEQEFAIRFPDDYRRFLLEFNGGRPANSNIAFAMGSGGSTIHTLYGIHPENDEGELEREIRWGRDEQYPLPETLVPIGSDDFGNLICLGVTGDEEGHVYFRDSGRLPAEPPRTPWGRWKGCTRIADSFSEFLASLMPRGED